ISGHSFSIPGYMVLAAIFYAASASVLSQVVGLKLVKLNADLFSKEAELRFTLMRKMKPLESSQSTPMKLNRRMVDCSRPRTSPVVL
ncbi:hypothetical protein ACC699_38825, partial [Rhizobium ruizarguesonis]